jgi:Sigma-70, region 4.
MTDKEIEKALDKYFQKKSNLYNKIVTEKNTYKKVEDMLRYYNRFKKRIIYIQDNMDNVILKKISGISSMGEGNFEYKSDIEKKEEIKEQNQKQLEKYKILVQLIERGLEEIKNDEYYKIIELRYFENETIENISEILSSSIRSVKRHRNRLINELCEILFPEEVLEKFL